jgi:hypothetical protein
MTAVRFALPASLVSQDAERIEGAQHILPFFPALLRLYWTQAGEFQRAAAYPIGIELPADVPSQDTTAIRLSLQGWEFAVRGDRETGLGLLEEGFRRLGTNDVWIVGPVVFVFAELLSQQPDRRTQGIRALRWFTRNSASDTGRAWLALGRALEADGDAAGARDAYGHVLRVWADADDYLADEVAEARTALQRLTAEIG